MEMARGEVDLHRRAADWRSSTSSCVGYARTAGNVVTLRSAIYDPRFSVAARRCGVVVILHRQWFDSRSAPG